MFNSQSFGSSCPGVAKGRRLAALGRASKWLLTSHSFIITCIYIFLGRMPGRRDGQGCVVVRGWVISLSGPVDRPCREGRLSACQFLLISETTARIAGRLKRAGPTLSTGSTRAHRAHQAHRLPLGIGGESHRPVVRAPLVFSPVVPGQEQRALACPCLATWHGAPVLEPLMSLAGQTMMNGAPS